jgi:hypothetical protein
VLQFPAIANHIFGEENNMFSNILGDTIKVEVQEDQVATASLLSMVCRSVISCFSYHTDFTHLHAANKILIVFCSAILILFVLSRHFFIP